MGNNHAPVEKEGLRLVGSDEPKSFFSEQIIGIGYRFRCITASTIANRVTTFGSDSRVSFRQRKSESGYGRAIG